VWKNRLHIRLQERRFRYFDAPPYTFIIVITERHGRALGGAWACTAKQLGVKCLLGVDGHWAAAQRVLRSDEFKVAHLDQADTYLHLNLPKADLVISLEVAEHLPETVSGSFIKLLCRSSEYVLFSAAVPRQGGDAHVNEQWPAYWYAHFVANGFECIDVIRRRIWRDPSVEWWYRQNVLLYCKSSEVERTKRALSVKGSGEPAKLVHPDRFLRDPNRRGNSYSKVSNWLKAKAWAVIG
jgi:hypothetical protein